MSVQEIYPTKIWVEQLDFPDEKITTIETYLRAQHLDYILNDLYDAREQPDGNENILGQAKTDGSCPELIELVDIIKQRFVSLAYSNIEDYEESNTAHTILETEVESCKINLMSTGRRLGVHTHYGDDAFACFYFNDVPPEEKGELVLYDPRWQKNYWFAGSKLVRISPRRGQLVIAPSFVWHEVAEYIGQDDRLTLVINADVNDVGNKVRIKGNTEHTT